MFKKYQRVTRRCEFEFIVLFYLVTRQLYWLNVNKLPTVTRFISQRESILKLMRERQRERVFSDIEKDLLTYRITLSEAILLSIFFRICTPLMLFRRFDHKAYKPSGFKEMFSLNILNNRYTKHSFSLNPIGLFPLRYKPNL